MTRLVVAPQTRSDLNGILEFLRLEAGELVALRYGTGLDRRFNSSPTFRAWDRYDPVSVGPCAYRR